MRKIASYLCAASLAILFCAAPNPVFGANGTWTNTIGGSWADPANWSGGTIPGGVGDTADFSTLTLGSAPVVTLDGATTNGNLILGDQGNAFGWTLSTGTGGPLTLAVSSGSPTITVNNQTNTISLVLAGTSGFTKEGTGMLTLTNANTITGPITLNNGTIKLFRPVGMSTNSSFTVNPGGVLDFDPNNAVWGAPAMPINLNGGTLSFSATGLQGKYALPGALVTVNTASSITVTNLGISTSAPNNSHLFLDGGLQGSADLTIAGLTSGLGLVLRNTNTVYTGKITVNGTASATAGTGSGLAVGALATTNFPNLTTADIVVNGTMEIGGGATGLGWANGTLTAVTVQMDALSGSGVVVGNCATSAKTRTLSVGNNNGSDTFSGVIANGVLNTMSLVKNGAGTQTLTGTNTYTGATTISAGALVIGGAGQLGGGAYPGAITNNAALSFNSTAAETLSGAITGTGSLTNSGPGTLTLSAVNTYSGTTTLNGGTTVGVTAGSCGGSSVTVATSAATLSVSITNNTKSWSCTNLTFAAAGTLNFNFGAITPSNSVAPLVVSNVAFTTTPTVTVQANVLGTLPIGSYPLMTWGSVSGTVPSGAVALPPHRGTATLSVTGNTLFLNITALGTQPLSWAASSGNWDIGLTSNWKDSANTATTFVNQDAVVFEDTVSGAGPITVTLVTNVAPASVVVTNNLKSYTLAGTGAITGTQALTKAGTNTFVLANANTYTGGTIITAGKLQLGDGVANNGVVAGNIVVSNGATLAFANPNDQTYAGVISGIGGALAKSGAGILTLTSGSTTNTGPTTITGGTLSLGLASTTVSFASPITVNSNTTLRYAPTAPCLIGAASTVNLNGALVYQAAGNSYQVLNGAVTANSASTIDVAAGGVSTAGLYFDGGLKGSAPITLTCPSNGVGLVLRTASNTYSGTLTVNGTASAVNGTGSGLALQTAGASMSNATFTINGTLELGGQAGGMGWASPSATALTTKIDALNGTGVVVANFASAKTAILSVGNVNGSGTFSGEIANGNNDTLSFIKAGTGTQTLSGINSYTGTTTVSGGTLLVNSPGSLAATVVTVQSGGTLGGNGSLSGAVTVQAGAKLTVGTNSAVGTLSIFNTLTNAANSTNVMRISKTGGVPASDQVTGLSSVTYGGTLIVSNITSDSNTLALGDTFTLYSPFATHNGSFTSFVLPPLSAGLSWNLNNLAVDGSISVTNQATAPIFNPPAGQYPGGVSVTISSLTSNSVIHYTTDGSDPTTSGTTISGPSPISGVLVPANTNRLIRAYATASGMGSSSESSASYVTWLTYTWTNTASFGNWSDTSSWTNNFVPNSAGAIADFTTLTLSLDTSVQLDIPATVGTLKFADLGNAYNWTLQNIGGNPLTLDAGTNQPGITVANSNTTISAILSGTNGFIKAGPGTLTLSGANTYTGNTVINAGVGQLRFTVSPPANSTFIGNGTVEFNFGANLNELGTFGSGFTGQINVTGAGTLLATLASTVMTNNLGDVNVDSSASWGINGSIVQVDELTGSGPVINAAVATVAPATLVLGANNGNGGSPIFSGAMTSSSAGNGRISIVKNGTGAQVLSGNLATGLGTVTVNGGTLTLSGTNSYTGATTVSNGTLRVEGSLAAGSAVTVVGGTLGGTGLIRGPVSVNGTLSPGASIGTLTISNSLALTGNVLIEVNKALAPSNDVVTVSGALSYGGTLTATNIGGTALVVGDSFPIFPAGGTGTFTLAGSPGPGLAWSFSPASGVLSVVTGVSTTPPHLTNSVSGGSLTLSWPADHLGWKLQCQTNSRAVGLSNNWITIPGSETMTSTNIPVSPANPTLFYRLTYP